MPRTNNSEGEGTRHIAIVGGGTAGWMAAAMLSRHVPPAQCRVTVVDDGTGGIGVGEATIPSVLRLVRMLGGDEAGFMQACDATWKLGIQFQNWIPGKDIWHPFGVSGARIDGHDLFPFWLSQLSRSESRMRPYHAYSLHWSAALAGKAPHGLTQMSPITAAGSYAFHLNAAGLSDWLKSASLRAGVVHVVDRVVKCHRADDGTVREVRLRAGESLAADFYLDCSGFDSVLQQGHPDVAWQPWSEQLLCDAAAVLSLPPTAIVPSHTRAMAMSAGWHWDIPLTSRRGIGYVYSQQHQSAEEATAELTAALKLKEHDVREVRHLSLKTGRRQKFWVGNVLSLGLSAGFAEPLESSGLHLTQVGIERFLDLFPSQPSQTELQAAYNESMSSVFDEVRDFIQLHYHLNRREGMEDDPSGFWKTARNAPLSASLQHRLKLYDEVGELPVLSPDAFGASSYYFLLTGSHQLPQRPPASALGVEEERVQGVLSAILEQNRGALRELPMHEESLRHVHPTLFARAS